MEKYIVNLPVGNQTTIHVNGSQITLIGGQVITNITLVKLFPKLFKKVEEKESGIATKITNVIIEEPKKFEFNMEDSKNTKAFIEEYFNNGKEVVIEKDEIEQPENEAIVIKKNEIEQPKKGKGRPKKGE
jgi:hypothetical protein